jgi:hypothetical protein
MRLTLRLCLAAVLLPRALSAQALVGVVRTAQDSTLPIPGAEVILGKRQTTTDAEGRFRIDSLARGTYPLTIRHIGFKPIRVLFEVGDRESTAEFYLAPSPQVLPDVVVEVRRTGIYGVVRDGASDPVPGAAVEALGNRGGATVTDTLGRFAFPDARNGTYLVRVQRPGFLERRLMVAVEPGKGRELVVRLAAGEDRPTSHSEAAALFELRGRLAWALSRQVMMGKDLERYGSLSVCDVPRVRIVVRQSEAGILNGDTRLLGGQLCTWHTDEISLIEFIDGPTRRGPGGPSRGDGYVIIWEKF